MLAGYCNKAHSRAKTILHISFDIPIIPIQTNQLIMIRLQQEKVEGLGSLEINMKEYCLIKFNFQVIWRKSDKALYKKFN